MKKERQYNCRKCGSMIGFRKSDGSLVWFDRAIPLKKMCDRCYCEYLKRKGIDTTFFEKTIHVSPFQHIVDAVNGKTRGR